MHKEGALFPLATARHKYEIDMCTGSLPQKILLFSLPLMATGMLQLLFNAADIIVVGRYVGSHALAAVGSNGSIINLIVNLFMGISIGGSAVIAQHYGAAQYEDVSEATHTCMLVGLISGFFVMVVGVVCTPAILRLMDTPDDVLPLAILYLRIYFLGMPGSMLYNFGAAVLRGVGDTRRPLIFLFFAGIVNVGLNLLLVIQFNLSVAGVGIATVVSQYISAALVLWCMLKTDGCYHIVLKELRIHRDKLIRILKIGIPAGLQGAIFSISNVLIQSSINSFGSTAMAGNAAAVNIEGFVFTSCNSVAQASLTFTSQNLGAGQYKRLRGITLWCLALGILLSEILGFIAYGFGNSLLAFYNKDSEVIAMGMIRMMIVGTTYGLDAIMDIMADIIRRDGQLCHAHDRHSHRRLRLPCGVDLYHFRHSPRSAGTLHLLPHQLDLDLAHPHHLLFHRQAPPTERPNGGSSISMSRMKLITLTLALLATLLVFTACGNPISEIVHGDPPQAGTPDASDPLSPEPEPEPEETEEQRRARLIKKMEDIFAAAEPMENYTFTLNDPVTVEGREYYYGVWQRVITDYDTQSRYLSTVAEFFITPDGDECYIGNHFPANEGNGETVVFSSGNIFEEINNG